MVYLIKLRINTFALRVWWVHNIRRCIYNIFITLGTYFVAFVSCAVCITLLNSKVNLWNTTHQPHIMLFTAHKSQRRHTHQTHITQAKAIQPRRLWLEKHNTSCLVIFSLFLLLTLHTHIYRNLTPFPHTPRCMS